MAALAVQTPEFLGVLVLLLLIGLAPRTVVEGAPSEEFVAIGTLEARLVELVVIVVLELALRRPMLAMAAKLEFLLLKRSRELFCDRHLHLCLEVL
jgi:hypothetical protein